VLENVTSLRIDYGRNPKNLTPSEKRLEELEKVYAALQAAYDKAQRYCSQLSRAAEDAYADLMSAQDANDKSETYIDAVSVPNLKEPK
jgi:hypothetical protein